MDHFLLFTVYKNYFYSFFELWTLPLTPHCFISIIGVAQTAGNLRSYLCLACFFVLVLYTINFKITTFWIFPFLCNPPHTFTCRALLFLTKIIAIAFYLVWSPHLPIQNLLPSPPSCMLLSSYSTSDTDLTMSVLCWKPFSGFPFTQHSLFSSSPFPK